MELVTAPGGVKATEQLNWRRVTFLLPFRGWFFVVKTSEFGLARCMTLLVMPCIARAFSSRKRAHRRSDRRVDRRDRGRPPGRDGVSTPSDDNGCALSPTISPVGGEQSAGGSIIPPFPFVPRAPFAGRCSCFIGYENRCSQRHCPSPSGVDVRRARGRCPEPIRSGLRTGRLAERCSRRREPQRTRRRPAPKTGPWAGANTKARPPRRRQLPRKG